MRHAIPYRSLVLLSLLACAGCEQRDPYMRTDVWRPTGANAGNIAAMVADPRDLIRGRDTAGQDSRAATLAVGQIWANQPTPLLQGASSSPSSMTPTASGAGGSGGSSGSGGS